jgi:hypothetical protein
MKAHWLNRERLRLYPLAVIAIYLILGGIMLFGRHRGAAAAPLGFDFVAFWAASHLVLSGAAVSAYDPQLLLVAEQAGVPGFSGAAPWWYPPTFLLLVTPLALLPYLASYLAFMGGTLLGYAAVVRKAVGAPGVALPLLGFPAVFVNLYEGQNGFLTAALMGAGLLLLPRRPAAAGLVLGLLAMKPHLGVLLPLALLCGRQWRALLFTALGAAAFTALSLALFGRASLDAFLAGLPLAARMVEGGRLPLAKMPTVFAAARLLGCPAQLAYILHAGVAVAAAAAVAWVWLRCRDLSLRAAALCTGTLLVSPYLFDYDLALLGLSIAWLVRHGLEQGWRSAEREWLALAWLLPLAMPLLATPTRLQPGPLVLLVLLLLILRRAGGATALRPQSTSP